MSSIRLTKGGKVEWRGPSNWFTRMGSRLAYKAFGPTTVHLDHEVCILVTASCLTSASLFSIYKLSFGSSLDFFYLGLTSVWLSRHFFHRLLCTTDVSTSLSGWTHNIRWMWIAVTSGGQYFDIPTLMFASTSLQPLIDIDDAYATTGGAGSIPITTAVSPFAFHRIWMVQNSVVAMMGFLWALLKACRGEKAKDDFRIYDADWSSSATTSAAGGKRNKHSDGSGSSERTSPSFGEHYRRCVNKINRKFDMWWQYVPPIQLLVLIFSVCGIVWFFQRYNEALSSYALPLRTPRSAIFDKNMANPRINSADGGSNMANSKQSQRDALLHNSDFMDRRLDHNQGDENSSVLWSRNFVYGPLGMMCMVISLGTVGPILVFGRIMPPLPDLVGGSSGISGRKSSKAQNDDKPWSEQYRSIANENRLHLHLKVLFLRVLECLLLCAILPRSEFICKASGHCDVQPMVSEIGNPTLAGVTGNRMYDNLIRDRLQDGLITATVLLTTTLLLVSQILVLDKSYLALRSFSESQDAAASLKRSSGSGGGSRRKPKTLGASDFDFSRDYNSTSQQRRGVMGKIYGMGEKVKKYCVELLSNELGALSTSRILSIGANIHVAYTLLVVVIWMHYAITGGNWYMFFLIYLALFSSAVEVGYLDSATVYDIADTINYYHGVKLNQG